MPRTETVPSLAKARLSNNAPTTRWLKCSLACGTERQRLFVDGCKTPFFIDVAKVLAHRSSGSRVGLYGSGMGKEIHCRDGGSYRIAALLWSGDKITPAKARAERLALSEDHDPGMAALKKEAEGDHDKAEHFLNKAVEYETEAKQMEGGA